MWNIIKSLFRYMLKHKVWLITLTFLTFLSTGIFSSLMTLSSNLSKSYDALVGSGNLNDGSIHELYSTTVVGDDSLVGEDAKKWNKEHFLSELDKEIGKENYRQFRAVDFTTTNSGYAYKIIESDINYTIDKTVIYEGRNVKNVTYDFQELIDTAIITNTSREGMDARREILRLATRAQWTTSSTKDNFKKLAEKVLVIDDWEKNDYDPIKVKDSGIVPFWQSSSVKFMKRWLNPTASDHLPLTNKGYRMAFDASGLSPVVGRIDNPSSYTVVVPQYVLENHGKKILPDDLYEQYLKYDDYNSSNDDVEFHNWKNYIVPEEYKIKIDNLEFIIVGTGLSPGFMYPVINLERSIPNIKTELLLYGNSGAFELAYDSNRSAPKDDYIIFKKENLAVSDINRLNEKARKYMSWPSSIKSVYMVNDTSNILTAQAVRVMFLPSLIKMQQGLSVSLSLFVGILTCIIFLFTVKKFINDNRASLTALRANGVKKRSIIASTMLFGTIPSVVGASLAYILCQVTQSSMIGLFSAYWVIPTAITIFNPAMFFGMMLVPLLLMGVLASSMAYLLLRKNTSQLMNDTSAFKVSSFAKALGLLFTKANVMTKFRTSIAFSSISKLTAITVLFTLSSVAVTSATAMTGKFEQTKKSTFDAKDYNFAVDLVTPTVQGGQYFLTEFDKSERAIVNDKNEVIKFSNGMVDPTYNSIRGQEANVPYLIGENGDYNYNFTKNVSLPTSEDGESVVFANQMNLDHYPSIHDASWQKSDLLYLKNKSQTPIIVDVEIGIAPIIANPWDIARNLSPPNTMNISDNLTNAYWNRVVNDDNVYFLEDDQKLSVYGINDSNKDIYVNKPLNKIYFDEKYFEFKDQEHEQNDLSYVYKWKDTGDMKKGWYKVDNKKRASLDKIKDSFVVLTNYVNQLPNYQDTIFKALYNSYSKEADDETYTTIDSNLIFKNYIEPITIKGVKPDSEYIKLLNSKDEQITSKLFLDANVEEKYKDNIHELYQSNYFDEVDTFDIIINESAAFQYKLEIGDKIIIDPTNEATRRNPKDSIPGSLVDYSEYNNAKFEFQIIDIAQTYQYPEFYINQRVANYINAMHLDEILETSFENEYVYSEKLNTDYIIPKQIDPFNGMFSRSDEVKAISQSISLYSESGLSPATDKFTNSDVLNKTIDATLKSTSADLNKPLEQSKYIAKIQLAEMFGFKDPETGIINWGSFNARYNEGGKPQVQLVINDIVNMFGDNPFTSTIYNVEYITMFEQIFDNIAVFTNSIMSLVLLILFAISIVSVMFLSVEFISTAISVIAVLKVLGFYDRTNAFSFLSMFFPAMIVGLGLSIPLSILVMNGVKSFIYGFANIYLPLSYIWWYFIIPGILLSLILAVTIGVSIYILKKQDPIKAINRY
ncbi:MAG: FtsX-like permease family protein [Mycoplasma sp.]